MRGAGFRYGQARGSTVAWTVAHGRPHPLVEPFRTSRFTGYDPVGENGAVSVGH